MSSRHRSRSPRDASTVAATTHGRRSARAVRPSAKANDTGPAGMAGPVGAVAAVAVAGNAAARGMAEAGRFTAAAAAVAIVATEAEAPGSMTPPRDVRLVAIDLDGTLVDSAPDIAHCLGCGLAAIGLPPPGEARTRELIGDGLEALLARAITHATGETGERSGTFDERHGVALRAFLDCYRDNLFVRSRLYPRVADTLDTLRGRGLRLCCITNKRESFSETLLTAAGIRDRFELLLGGDSLPEKKPSPLQLRVAAERLGMAASDAALVGDSHQDLGAARHAGFGFVLASYGYGRVAAAELGTAPRIGAFAELPAALGLGADAPQPPPGT